MFRRRWSDFLRVKSVLKHPLLEQLIGNGCSGGTLAVPIRARFSAQCARTFLRGGMSPTSGIAGVKERPIAGSSSDATIESKVSASVKEAHATQGRCAAITLW